MRMLASSVAILCFGIAVGCSPKQEKIETFPVSGQVIYDGQPAAGVQVFLYPMGAPAVPLVPVQPHGTTDSEGRFKLSTYGEDDGAAAGSYRVVLFWPKEPKEDEEESDEDRLLGWYTAIHSKIMLDVKPGENTVPPLKLPVRKVAAKVGGEGIPGRN